ncbi:amidase [Basidiobolus meristosporus CBS 931.73]|uniref:Amidase n=1 Tax=Basidiobolus meristosporus CBS 931.73 TaxID=1314790 RepID=A0A1Y1YQQ1_9FUNG|nr:amidase [Basidiobolus meristosporus CBS 931.73]|eukprot:ORY00350.1 amidase [Basidiobolus meristosporus CBS 931.73]
MRTFKALTLVSTLCLSVLAAGQNDTFQFEEASILDIQTAFSRGTLTSRQLVQWYVDRIHEHDHNYNSISEMNPDIFKLADKADAERKAGREHGLLHGIPILLKDNIATGDQMHNTAGSLALYSEECKPTRDSTIASKLRKAGALIFGKACMSEWANLRTTDGSGAEYKDPDGWSGRCGQTHNAYNITRSPSGSSGGPAVAVALNFVTASIGTDTDCSIIAPAAIHGLVGIRPTVGLISRDLVIPISHSQDTPGPMAKSVTDAAIMLEALAGKDPRDPLTNMPPNPNKSIKYTRYLKKDGLRGARIGIPRHLYWEKFTHPEEKAVAEQAIEKLRSLGATIVDPADIPTADQINDPSYGLGGLEFTLLNYEFKQDVKAYLSNLKEQCPMKDLADLIQFNKDHAAEEMPYFKQEVFEIAQNTTDLNDPFYKETLRLNRELSGPKGIDTVFKQYNLDAMFVPVDWGFFPPQPLAMAGYPQISIPVGIDQDGVPFGMSFYARAYDEPKLIKYAYAFEQATKARRPPQLL